MLSEFEQANVKDHQRITAVNPKTLDKYSIELPVTLHRDHITPEEYCCTLSHLEAILVAWKAGDEAALILEDDVRIIRWPGNLWNVILSSAPKKWQILHMLPIGTDAVRLLNNEATPLFVPWRSGLWGTAAYIINRDGMQQVLSKYAPEYTTGASLANIDFTQMPTDDPRARCVADWAIYAAANTWTCTDVFFSEMGEDSTIKQADLPLHQETLKAITEIETSKKWKVV